MKHFKKNKYINTKKSILCLLKELILNYLIKIRIKLFHNRKNF